MVNSQRLAEIANAWFNPLESFDIERLFFKRAVRQNSFIYSDVVEVPGSDGTFNAHIKNPSDSGRTAIFTSVTADSQFSGKAEVFDGFSSDPADGTSYEVDNIVMDSSGDATTGNMEVNENVNFTADSTHSGKVLGGGEGAFDIGSTGTLPVFALEPGREIVLQITNQSTSSDSASVNIVYFEIDEVISNRWS